MVKDKDTYHHKGWLTSDSFWKRAFAIWGHNIIASFVITVALYSLFFVFWIIFGS